MRSRVLFAVAEVVLMPVVGALLVAVVTAGLAMVAVTVSKTTRFEDGRECRPPLARKYLLDEGVRPENTALSRPRGSSHRRMEDAGIYARRVDALGRVVQVGIASGQVLSVSFPESVPDDAEPDHPVLRRLLDYLDGAEVDLSDVPTAITVPTDQRAVLDATRQIPYGETGTLRQVALMANLDPDDEDDAEAVRRALRENPVPMVVPDHRVEDVAGATPADVAATLRDLER